MSPKIIWLPWQFCEYARTKTTITTASFFMTILWANIINIFSFVKFHWKLELILNKLLRASEIPNYYLCTIIFQFQCFWRFRTYISYLVLKWPALGACWLNSCHLLFFYWFISYCWAFLKANFNAFILIFFDFFTFYWSLGKIFKCSGILN